MINATYKSQQQVHICWVFLAFKHQTNQQTNGENESHHQKLWSTEKYRMIKTVHVWQTAKSMSILVIGVYMYVDILNFQFVKFPSL